MKPDPRRVAAAFLRSQALKKKAGEEVTKTFEVTAHPDTMEVFESFLAFLHYNGGHSAIFGMAFDGDGHDFLRVDPAPDKKYSQAAQNIGGAGPELELAKGRDGYEALNIDRDKRSWHMGLEDKEPSQYEDQEE